VTTRLGDADEHTPSMIHSMQWPLYKASGNDEESNKTSRISMDKRLNADAAYSLWDDGPIDDAFELTTPNNDGDVAQAVVSSVARPWLLKYDPSVSQQGRRRAILILGGGGYVELMAGREGYQVAQWLNSLGFHAFVLIHRFPNKETGAQAPLDDARRALRMIHEQGYGADGLGLCGLSSGGHLGAALLSDYPAQWTERKPRNIEANPSLPKLDFAIVGYGPISTNAKGRQVIADKKPLAPPEKQQLYDTVQPDVQLNPPAPPTFIVYSGTDPVVPVVNAYRLAEGIAKTGAMLELHIFADAPHGFALDTVGLPVSKWTGMCEEWLKQGGHVVS
jgi:acetyl esterase/lipase